MGSVNASGKSSGPIRRLLSRLSPHDERPHSCPEPRGAEAGRDCTPIGACGDRQIVKVIGTLRTVTLRARAGVPALEAELSDGSASLSVVWLGRRDIAGIEPGTALIASGRIAMHHGRPVLFNPKYELLPPGQE
ncbi:OB-fold nucleic acid binding domain-containing protein [Streptomyces sp. P38-E01]|uniref:OB-fold nucleic acid binding domain-containing protein n=1 Tax=Streptomyces tardus TaxID=2780544 RepID=A0A949JUH9_9ACTN|nr:OB-fold nucleic acid binding domain-containing protein [Streptomyces tardus]MBU7600355.1 OB-fold nucleic acid binding domain-containing protein [Streptomyces tardus]